jgi:hypothetical protein
MPIQAAAHALADYLILALALALALFLVLRSTALLRLFLPLFLLLALAALALFLFLALLLPLPLTLSVLFLPLPLFLALLPGYQRFTRLFLLDGGGLHSQWLAFEILLDRRRQAAAAPRPAQRSGQSLPTGEERQSLCIAQ